MLFVNSDILFIELFFLFVIFFSVFLPGLFASR